MLYVHIGKKSKLYRCAIRVFLYSEIKDVELLEMGHSHVHQIVEDLVLLRLDSADIGESFKRLGVDD